MAKMKKDHTMTIKFVQKDGKRTRTKNKLAKRIIDPRTGKAKGEVKGERKKES